MIEHLFKGAFKTGKALLSGAGEIATGVGKVAMNTSKGFGGKIIDSFGTDAGKVLLSAASGAMIGGVLADQDGQVDTGKAAFKGAVIGTAASAIPGGASLIGGLGVAGIGAVGTALGGMKALGNHMVKTPKKMVSITDASEFHLNKKFAVPVLIGAMAIEGIQKGVKNFERSRMGVNDGQFRTATPQMIINNGNANGVTPGYVDNAGATGDLVFALHNNRNSGLF